MAPNTTGRAISCRLLGVGAMNSPRFRPAGVLVQQGDVHIMIDGGPGSAPSKRIDAWLVTDARADLIRDIRMLAKHWRLYPCIAGFQAGGLLVEPKPVVHTSHPTYGYLIQSDEVRIVWAPEFFAFPTWARAAHLMFADAASFSRPIRFAGGVGGHMAAIDVSRAARRLRVDRLVFAHIGRPSIRAIDVGQTPPYGEWGIEGATYPAPPRRR